MFHLEKFRYMYRPIMYQPGDGQTSCKVWLTSVKRCWCSNEAKTRNRLKFAGVPKTRQPISAVSGSKFARTCWGYYCCLINFFQLSIRALVAKLGPIARQSCAMVRRWRFFAWFLRPVFQRAACSTSNLHCKFALRPHHVWTVEVSNLRPLRIGDEKRRKKKKDRNLRCKI